MAAGKHPKSASLRNPRKKVRRGGYVVCDGHVWLVVEITKRDNMILLSLEREGEQPIEVQARFCDPGPRWGGGNQGG